MSESIENYNNKVKPREYGFDFIENKIIYDCPICCIDVNFNDEKCKNGHKLDWSNCNEMR